MLQIIIIVLIVLIAISEFADWITYGGFLKEEKSEDLSKKLSEHCFSSKGIIHWKALDFVCKKWGFSSRWYIHKDGDQKRIFITSKMNKLLNEKYKQLRKDELQKSKSLLD